MQDTHIHTHTAHTTHTTHTRARLEGTSSTKLTVPCLSSSRAAVADSVKGRVTVWYPDDLMLLCVLNSTRASASALSCTPKNHAPRQRQPAGTCQGERGVRGRGRPSPCGCRAPARPWRPHSSTTPDHSAPTSPAGECGMHKGMRRSAWCVWCVWYGFVGVHLVDKLVVAELGLQAGLGSGVDHLVAHLDGLGDVGDDEPARGRRQVEEEVARRVGRHQTLQLVKVLTPSAETTNQNHK
jgi:hypothetical protein